MLYRSFSCIPSSAIIISQMGHSSSCTYVTHPVPVRCEYEYAKVKLHNASLYKNVGQMPCNIATP